MHFLVDQPFVQSHRHDCKNTSKMEIAANRPSREERYKAFKIKTRLKVSDCHFVSLLEGRPYLQIETLLQ